MDIKIKDLKDLIWHGSLLKYRLFQLIDGHVDIDSLPLLWETK